MQLTIMRYKYYVLGVAAFIAISIIAGIYWTDLTFGNPYFGGQIARSSTATGTPTVMTPGTGTTTLVYDSFGLSGTNQTNPQGTQLPDSAVLAVQLQASSTFTSIRINIEQSNDGIDWYNKAIPSNELSTTTKFTSFSNLEYHFASTSAVTNSGEGNNFIDASQYRRDINRFFINLPTDMRFVRTIIWMPASSLNAMIYAEIMPKKQVK